MSNHLNVLVPVGISQIVHKFASNKQDPIFFIEKDNLLLSVNWDTDHRDPFSTHFVARRRHTEESHYIAAVNRKKVIPVL